MPDLTFITWTGRKWSRQIGRRSKLCARSKGRNLRNVMAAESGPSHDLIFPRKDHLVFCYQQTLPLRNRLHDKLQTLLFSLAIHWRCHQRPDRSFFIQHRQVPLCARCFGLLIGLIISPGFIWIPSLALLAATSTSLLIIDAVSQALKWRESTNLLRSITGIFVGATLPGCAIRSIVQWL